MEERTKDPGVAIGLAAWQVWGRALHWSDVFLFVGMYVLTGLGITVGFHRHLTHRAFKTSRAMNTWRIKGSVFRAWTPMRSLLTATSRQPSSRAPSSSMILAKSFSHC